MNALLLNDTRSERHLGCDLVIANILAECRRVGIDVVATAPNSASDDERQVASRIGQIDLLLVNGEGTMHDDRPKALQLARAARIAHEQGVRTVLFNTTWQNNLRLMEFLNGFDRVFCRESYSAREVRDAGVPAHVVPDMVFALRLSVARGVPPQAVGDAAAPCGNMNVLHREEGPWSKQVHRERELVTVLDSVRRKTTVRLARAAILHGYGFFPLQHERWEWVRADRLYRLLSFLRGAQTPSAAGLPQSNRVKRPSARMNTSCADVNPEGSNASRDGLIECLSRSRVVVSGRFHGTCLSLMLERPVIAIGSNSHKVEALFHDVGLDPRCVRPLKGVVRGLSYRRLIGEANHLRDRMECVRQYVADAPARIQNMFDQIRWSL